LANWYITREKFKRALNVNDATRDPIIDLYIESASREFDRLTDQWFIPKTQTRSYSWPQPGIERPYVLELDAPLISVSALTKDDDDVTAIASTDYFLEPTNSGPPYHWVEIDLSSTAFYSSKNTHQRGIRVTGSWAYGNDTIAAGALAEADDGSETVLDVTDASLIDVGDTILIGSEQMFVSGRATLDTTANLNGALTATKSQTTVTVTDGTQIKNGETIEVDSERMLVTSISSNDLTVVRSQDGTVLAAHDDAKDVYAFRSLTITRGANSTTAAAHDTATAITKYQPPARVQTAVLDRALLDYSASLAGNTGQAGGGGGGRVIDAAQAEKQWLKVVVEYKRYRFGAA